MPKKIVIADDDPVCREILTQILSSREYEVCAFDCGLAIMDSLPSLLDSENPPVLIFLDVMLGDTTGIKVLEFIRYELLDKKTPVVMLSANSKHEVTAIHGGPEPELFLEKPFVADTVLSALDEVLSNASICPI